MINNMDPDQFTSEVSSSVVNISYAPNFFSKLGGHIASGLLVRSFVRLFVRSSRFLVQSITLEPDMLMFWNFIYGFLMKI